LMKGNLATLHQRQRVSLEIEQRSRLRSGYSKTSFI
jgi:hypothetical protein